MGVLIKTTGAGGSIKIGHTPPITRGLLYYGFLGDDASQTVRNYAPGGAGGGALAAGTLRGAPTYQPGYAQIGNGTHAINSGVLESAAYTWIVVARSSDILDNRLHRPGFVSNRETPAAASSGRTVGAALFVGGTSTAPVLTHQNWRWSGTAQAFGRLQQALTVAQLASWLYIEASDSGAAGAGALKLRVRNLAMALAADQTQPRDVGSLPLIIGGETAGSASQSEGKGDIAFVALFSVDLTDAERDAVRASVNLKMASRIGTTL